MVLFYVLCLFYERKLELRKLFITTVKVVMFCFLHWCTSFMYPFARWSENECTSVIQLIWYKSVTNIQMLLMKLKFNHRIMLVLLVVVILYISIFMIRLFMFTSNKEDMKQNLYPLNLSIIDLPNFQFHLNEGLCTQRILHTAFQIWIFYSRYMWWGQYCNGGAHSFSC